MVDSTGPERVQAHLHLLYRGVFYTCYRGVVHLLYW